MLDPRKCDARGFLLVWSTKYLAQLAFVIAVGFLNVGSTLRGQETKALIDTLTLPQISVIKGNFPLSIQAVNFQARKNKLSVNDAIEAGIEDAVKQFYFNECSGDSTETFFTLRSVYFNTILLSNEDWSVFLVLMQHKPTGALNCKILFYENGSKEFVHKPLDFNLHALYHIERGALMSTDLRKHFDVKIPEVSLIDFDRDGKDDFEFVRLYHNGSANAIETTVLSVRRSSIDTLKFERVWVK